MLLIFLATLAIALLAQWQVKRMYRRFSQVPATSGYTGAEVANEILREAGIRDVEIIEHDEMLGDHYLTLHKRLVL
jgi:Zn-dependent membrane protease YugP